MVDSSLDFSFRFSILYVVIIKIVSGKLADIYDEARWKSFIMNQTAQLYETSDDMRCWQLYKIRKIRTLFFFLLFLFSHQTKAQQHEAGWKFVLLLSPKKVPITKKIEQSQTLNKVFIFPTLYYTADDKIRRTR